MLNTTVSHYRIVEHLGGGGMGVVYKAEDTKLGRTVALKFLPPEWSRDPVARERFLREARAASALEDSRICTIHDIDETEDGQLFIAMALYEGETLKKRLQRGRLSIGQAVDVAIQMAEGLDRAHSAGIIHRDIKPANLMLTERDEVVIVDFGLAKLAGDLSLTKSGWSMGTPLYMSPEQSRGDRADERTDLWSLGVVLYEMLTGRPPFVGENHTAVARAILDDAPPPLDILRPDAPVELGEILTKALEKEPDSRYQSAADLLTDLRRLKNEIPETEGLTLASPSRTTRRRQSLVPVVLAAGVVVVAVAAVVWIMQSTAVHQQVDESPPRIVVLPFENLGPPEDEYFADGMTEEIISRLAAVGGLRVISRTSAMQYKGTDKAIRQIGDELNVQYALEGTVRWERTDEGHGRVRITPQLIDVTDDSHLWSDRYDRAIESVFEVQSDIAKQVVGQLHVSLLKPEEAVLDARPTANPEAYEAYLRGLHHYSINDIDQTILSISLFERAVMLDPGFAVAWANLSMSQSWLFYARDRTPELRAAAKQSAERTMALDSHLPEGHRALGNFYYYCQRDYEQALEEFARTLATYPKDTSALRKTALILHRQGRWEDSVRLMERALETSPRDAVVAHDLSHLHSYLKNFRRAAEYADMAINLAPDSVDGYLIKFSALFVQGRFSEARAVIAELPMKAPTMRLNRIILEIAERRFGAALKTINDAPVAVYEQVFGADGQELRLLDECACYFFLGDKQGVQEACGLARGIFEESTRESPHHYHFGVSPGLTYAFLGRKEDAIREGELAVELMPVSKDAIEGPTYIEHLAVIYALVGEPEAAIDQIEYLLSIPSLLTVGYLRAHPYWDPLRHHPRFQALLEEYGEE